MKRIIALSSTAFAEGELLASTMVVNTRSFIEVIYKEMKGFVAADYLAEW